MVSAARTPCWGTRAGDVNAIALAMLTFGTIKVMAAFGESRTTGVPLTVGRDEYCALLVTVSLNAQQTARLREGKTRLQWQAVSCGITEKYAAGLQRITIYLLNIFE